MPDALKPYADSGWPSIEADDLPQIESPDEPMGTKEKFWVRREDDANRQWLFKFARAKDGEVRGEDWAEVLVHRLASLIGVPTAVVVPATYPNVARENPNYTVEAVEAAFSSIQALDQDFDVDAAITGFASYLMLDAWTAGQDRHHQNWAVIAGGRTATLAPSFDHGNALGFQENDERIVNILSTADGASAWAGRGRSPHFAGRPKLVDLATEALSKLSPNDRAALLKRLSGVNFEEVEDIVSGVPAALMSASRASFVMEILRENKRRLLDGA